MARLVFDIETSTLPLEQLTRRNRNTCSANAKDCR